MTAAISLRMLSSQLKHVIRHNTVRKFFKKCVPVIYYTNFNFVLLVQGISWTLTRGAHTKVDFCFSYIHIV